MLWYKAWRETQLRFTIVALLMTALCLAFILLHKAILPRLSDGETVSWTEYVYRFAFGGYARVLFITMVPIMGLGGLREELSLGTAAFTLALPVSRFQLIAVRAAVGLLEMIALASLPMLLVPSLSLLGQRSYPFTQALQFFLLWISCGAALFAEAFLFSVLLTGEYAALVASFLTLFLYTLLVQTPVLRAYPIDILWIIDGWKMPYLSEHTRLLIGPFPWTILSVIVLIALTLLAAAARIERGQDF
jgi:ABC-2 type transport system permease protein